MSSITHKVDAGEQQKGKGAKADGNKKQDPEVGAGADGKLSKKQQKKLEEAEKKAKKKAGGDADAEPKAAGAQKVQKSSAPVVQQQKPKQIAGA